MKQNEKTKKEGKTKEEKKEKKKKTENKRKKLKKKKEREKKEKNRKEEKKEKNYKKRENKSRKENKRDWSSCLLRTHVYGGDPLRLDLTTNGLNRLIGLVGWVFVNGPGDRGSLSGQIIPKTLKMVLDTSLLNT